MGYPILELYSRVIDNVYDSNEVEDTDMPAEDPIIVLPESDVPETV